eukprot:scaffold1220_cov259-Pinguiococcus_pyrenoidosus.AAC.157
MRRSLLAHPRAPRGTCPHRPSPGASCPAKRLALAKPRGPRRRSRPCSRFLRGTASPSCRCRCAVGGKSRTVERSWGSTPAGADICTRRDAQRQSSTICRSVCHWGKTGAEKENKRLAIRGQISEPPLSPAAEPLGGTASGGGVLGPSWVLRFKWGCSPRLGGWRCALSWPAGEFSCVVASSARVPCSVPDCMARARRVNKRREQGQRGFFSMGHQVRFPRRDDVSRLSRHRDARRAPWPSPPSLGTLN